MLRGPPAFTLFPYTTLFRSQLDVVVDLLRRRHEDADSAIARFHAECPPNDPFCRLLKFRPAILGFFAGALCGFRRDRKSTRLNSSHANISYAVFCLKKKKTQ